MKIIASAVSLLASLSSCNAEASFLRANISTDESTTIIDLSQDIPRDEAAISSSPGAKAVQEAASQDSFIKNVMVLENGSIVSSYTHHGADPSELVNVWSVTKSWMSLLFGMMIEDGLLSLDETLGDIFPDDAAWADITDGSTDFRKSATIEELLTFTSGFFDNDEVFPQWGGQSLPGSLSYPRLGTKGEWKYLAMSQIHSYIIKERTGMTPRQYLAKNVMGKFGVGEDEYGWWQNDDGIEMGAIALFLTPMQMAKFGQLYLQGGRTNPSNDERLVSEEWIDASLTHQSTSDFNADMGNGERGQGQPYGYWFGGIHTHPNGSIVFCGIGKGGNHICVDRYLDRVLVVQRDGPGMTVDDVLDLFIDSTLSFRASTELSGVSSTVESLTE